MTCTNLLLVTVPVLYTLAKVWIQVAILELGPDIVGGCQVKRPVVNFEKFDLYILFLQVCLSGN